MKGLILIVALLGMAAAQYEAGRQWFFLQISFPLAELALRSTARAGVSGTAVHGISVLS